MTTDTTHDLTLPEELLLIALDDESGAGRSDLALAGGVLAELSFVDAIVFTKERRRTFVEVVSSPPVLSDPLLAECLGDIVDSRKHREAAHWIQKFGAKKNLKGRVAAPLVRRGVLDERKRKFLFIELTQYPESNPVVEAEMTERLQSAIEHDHITPDPRTTALAVIANAAGILRNNLDKKMLRSRKDRLAQLAEGDHVSEAVKSSIAAVNAAVMVAVAAGAVASS